MTSADHKGLLPRLMARLFYFFLLACLVGLFHFGFLTLATVKEAYLLNVLRTAQHDERHRKSQLRDCRAAWPRSLERCG